MCLASSLALWRRLPSHNLTQRRAALCEAFTINTAPLKAARLGSPRLIDKSSRLKEARAYLPKALLCSEVSEQCFHPSCGMNCLHVVGALAVLMYLLYCRTSVHQLCAVLGVTTRV